MKIGILGDNRFGWDGGTRYFTTSNWRRVLISGYAQAFDKVHIFCRCSLMNLDSVPQTEIIDLPNVTFTRLPQFKGLQGYLWHRHRIFRQIQEGLSDCDVCLVSIPSQIGSAGIKVARSLGIPVVCQLIGDAQMVFRDDKTLVPTEFLRRIVSTLAFYYQRWSTNLCPAQTSISRALAEKFCHHPEKTGIFPETNLVDESFLPFRPRHRDEVFNALYVGRVEYHKNVQLFLHALAELRKRRKNIKTTIVGSGCYLPFLTQLADKLHITDAVHFTGRVDSREELLEYYRQAHMLYLLSFTEGLGIVLLEAGAASLPIIGSRIGGIPEIAHEGQNAFLICPDDVRACAEVVERLVDDEALREKMGRRSQEIARPYTVEYIIARRLEFIRSFLSEK